MLKNEFALGLMKETPDAMATQLAMWDNLSLWNVAWKKTSGFFSEQDQLRLQLDAECRRLVRTMSPRQMRVQVLFRLAGQAQIPLPAKLTAGDLDDLCERITKHAVLVLRQTDKTFKGTSSREMSAHVLKKMFEDLSKRFESQDADTQEKVIESILDGIKKMPPEQQERLRKELNVDELTNETVRKALVTGSLGAAFAVVIEVAGFSAYIFAVKLLAAVAGLVGITLPFAVYTTLTSFMAFLANPWILVPALVVLGGYLTRRANRKIRDGLFPIVVTQGVVSSALEETGEKALKEFIEAYETARGGSYDLEPLEEQMPI